MEHVPEGAELLAKLTGLASVEGVELSLDLFLVVAVGRLLGEAVNEVTAPADVLVVGADVHDGPDDLHPVGLGSLSPGEAEAHDNTVEEFEGDIFGGGVRLRGGRRVQRSILGLLVEREGDEAGGAAVSVLRDPEELHKLLQGVGDVHHCAISCQDTRQEMWWEIRLAGAVDEPIEDVAIHHVVDAGF